MKRRYKRSTRSSGAEEATVEGLRAMVQFARTADEIFQGLEEISDRLAILELVADVNFWVTLKVCQDGLLLSQRETLVPTVQALREEYMATLAIIDFFSDLGRDEKEDQ
jgi:hypothetical protein